VVDPTQPVHRVPRVPTHVSCAYRRTSRRA
jgi:hypothetical protein